MMDQLSQQAYQLKDLKLAENLKQIEKRLGISLITINKFCQRWNIIELALFGSILRDDFKSESDIDFLVTFSPEIKIGFKELLSIEKELKILVKRDIDLVFKNTIKNSQNWIKKRNILENAEVIYGKG
jgi:uncharacterized protein